MARECRTLRRGSRGSAAYSGCAASAAVLPATQRQRAEQRRILGGFTHQRTARFRLFAGADKHRDIAAHGGSRVAGCSTLAPKVAISAASSKAMTSMRFAAGHARIGGVDARDVGPDIDAGGKALRRAERRYNRCRRGRGWLYDLSLRCR